MASSEKQSNAYALLAPSDSDNGPIQGSDATVSVGLKDALPTKELRASPVEVVPTSEPNIPLWRRILGQKATGNSLIYEPLPLSDLDQGIVGWDSQDDAEMPFNFPTRQKWIWVWLLCAMTLLTPLASSILSPGIQQFSEEFGNTNDIVGSMTVSIYLLGYVVGPIFIAPLSEIYGRKPVLTVSNIFFSIWQIGCALAPNVEGLVVSRFFSGLGGAACLTLGGPTIGPLLGGFITKTIGWRWDFWIVLIIAVPATALIAFLPKESSHKVLMHRKTMRLRRQLGRPVLKSCYDDSDETDTVKLILTSLIRPLKMLVFSPLVLFLSLYIGFVFGVIYLLYTTIPAVFAEQYGFGSDRIGLIYLALGLGNVLGWLVSTLFSDKLIVRLAKANRGVFEPEMRLLISICFGAFLPITLFWYGWSAHYNASLASTIISLVPYGFGIMGLFLPITTYIVDCHPLYAASAIAANVILRSFIGACLPLAGPPMYASLGLGWGNSLLGYICVVMIPIPLVFYKFGAKLRKV